MNQFIVQVPQFFRRTAKFKQNDQQKVRKINPNVGIVLILSGGDL